MTVMGRTVSVLVRWVTGMYAGSWKAYRTQEGADEVLEM
jgi:hypothetical protein